jgi:hypothetical protein
MRIQTKAPASMDRSGATKANQSPLTEASAFLIFRSSVRADDLPHQNNSL